MPPLFILAYRLCCGAPAVLHAPFVPVIPAVVEATANPNTAAAGRLHDGVLALSLFATRARWHPLAADGPTLEADAFGEEGRAPSVPGPLVRVPLGTRVELHVRNALPDTLVFSWRCLTHCDGSAVRVAPGETGVLSTTPRVAGTFAYWGSLVRHGELVPGGDGAQLVGAIVVQAPGALLEPILALSTWDVPDSAKGARVVFLINGKSWPYTERFTYTVGDSVRWRVVHLGGGEHPMHLHGFYFRVVEQSDGDTTRAIPTAEQSLVVTQEIGTLSSALIAWSPDRPGNWLFHCHKAFHISPDRNDDAANRPYAQPSHHEGGNHATDGMGGLVIGMTVLPAGAPLPAVAPHPVTRLRLLVNKHDHYWGAEPGLGYVLQRGDSVPARDSVLVPGPVLALTRGEQTQITVVNQTDEQTAVHWHGIELESYFDGVAGWSGAGRQLAPLIAPGDSFVAIMTPPRAGTSSTTRT